MPQPQIRACHGVAHVQSHSPRHLPRDRVGRVADGGPGADRSRCGGHRHVRVRGVIVHVDAEVADRQGPQRRSRDAWCAPADMRGRSRGAARVTAADHQAQTASSARASMPQPDGTQRAVEVLVFPGSRARHRRRLPRPGTYMPERHDDQRHRRRAVGGAGVGAGRRPETGAQVQGRRKDRDRARAARPIVTFKPGNDDQAALAGARAPRSSSPRSSRSGQPDALRACWSAATASRRPCDCDGRPARTRGRADTLKSRALPSAARARERAPRSLP